MTRLTEAPPVDAASAEVPVADLVARYGLTRAGARPSLVSYSRQLWTRRHFVLSFAHANNAVGYSSSVLGQAWQLLTPLLNAAVFYLIFGVLLHTSRGVHNFIAFLVIGIFTFTYLQAGANGGSRAVSGNLALTRVLSFPRVVLPLSAVLVALQQLLFSMVVVIPIVLATGEPVSWTWLLLVPTFALETAFTFGLACATARLGARVADTSQVLPFVLRTWMYGSGVFYSIAGFAHGHAHWVGVVLQVNPGAVFVELARGALLSHAAITAAQWWLAVGWSVAVAVLGYVWFWRAEEAYGRD